MFSLLKKIKNNYQQKKIYKNLLRVGVFKPPSDSFIPSQKELNILGEYYLNCFDEYKENNRTRLDKERYRLSRAKLCLKRHSSNIKESEKLQVFFRNLSHLEEKYEVCFFTDFEFYIYDRFGKETLRKTKCTLKEIQVPEPVNSDEFIHGCEGGIIFLNSYAMVVKLEPTKSNCCGERIPHNSVLQPVFSHVNDNAMVEIYPGVHIEDITKDDLTHFHKYLNKEGIGFADPYIRNVGRLPYYTVEFPEGMPVVIDRLSVSTLRTALELKESLGHDFFQDVSQVGTDQYKAYKPLYDAFNRAFDHSKNIADTKKMKKAWQLCVEFKENKNTLTEWLSDDEHVKTHHPIDQKFIGVGAKPASINFSKKRCSN